MKENEQSATRRDILKLGGAALTTGALIRHGASLAEATQQTHEIVINAPHRGDGAYPYAFSVSGEIEKISMPAMAKVNPNHVTVDAEDDIDGCTVRGWSAGGYDGYRYTGDLVSFSVPEQWEDRYNVYLDGHKVPASELQAGDPDADGCGDATEEPEDDSGGNVGQFKSEIHIEVPEGSTAVFEIGVSGLMALPDGSETKIVTANMGGIGATGGRARIPYSGTISHMYLTDYDMEIRIVQDGELTR